MSLATLSKHRHQQFENITAAAHAAQQELQEMVVFQIWILGSVYP
jgi:hypothetical protein